MASDKGVGGADVAQQVIRAGLVDEVGVDLVPVLLGAGIRFFDHLGTGLIELERTRVVEAPGVTHLRFRVVKQKGEMIMADNTNNGSQAYEQPSEPNRDLRSLDRLVGMWEMSGDVQGTVVFEWMEGGFFLIQRVDLGRPGQRIKGIEGIGHERKFGAEPSEDIKSRFYSNTGDTLDYVYELEGDTLTTVGRRKGFSGILQGHLQRRW